RLLTTTDWHVRGVKDAIIHSARGVAIREFPLADGHGYTDYLLYVDGKAAGVAEAKNTGVTLQSKGQTAGPDASERACGAGTMASYAARYRALPLENLTSARTSHWRKSEVVDPWKSSH
ncbi:MAG: hypothetical protein KIS74_02075, partial [Burkholderiales bacterium]|nr:hypothetical protein [Burkholderiales bacterium]